MTSSSLRGTSHDSLRVCSTMAPNTPTPTPLWRRHRRRQQQQQQQRCLSERYMVLATALTTLVLAITLPTAHANGADLVGRFYLAERLGESVDVLKVTESVLTDDAKRRLTDFPSLSWGLLTGLQQRALLWDAGLVFTSDSTVAQVLTSCSNTMADIMLDAQVVEQLVQSAQTAGASTACTTTSCGGNSRFLEATCPTDALAAATRCVVDSASAPIQALGGVYWAEDGGNDELPTPILRDHSLANASSRLFAIHMTPRAFSGVSACEAMNRIIIPCREKLASDTNLCPPAPGRTLDAWLRFAAVPDAKTFSTTSGVLLVLLLAVVAALSGVIYYLVVYRLGRTRSARHSDASDVSSLLLSHEPLANGATPTDAFGLGNHSSDATVSNDALCASSAILRRFVSNPAVVTKRIAVAQLTFLRVLSKGGNGEVWLGQFETRYVALKCLLATKRDDLGALERFTDEVRLASVLEHPRIVAFIGVAWQSLLHLCAVTEYLERGDLEAVLSRSSLASTLTWTRDKLLIATDIAEALVYLHSLEPVVIHRDLKSKNVLLNRHLRAKLSDFGLSRETSVVDTMTNGVGTILWSAPEVLEGKRYDEKADIFSFGVVLSEIDTCMLPYGFQKDKVVAKSKSKMKSMQIVHLVAEGKLLPSFRDDCPTPIVELARACLELEPDKRPTAMEVVYRLRSKILPQLVALGDDDGTTATSIIDVGST